MAYLEQTSDFYIDDKRNGLTINQKEDIFEALCKFLINISNFIFHNFNIKKLISVSNSNHHKVTFFEAHKILNFIESEYIIKTTQKQSELQYQIPQAEIVSENIEQINEPSSPIGQQQNQQKDLLARIKFEMEKV